jgi:hypothetical protein
MHAVTIRRMIVFGVCALGVGSLYLVPGVARSPEQIRVSGASDEPTTSPAGMRLGTPQQSASHNSGGGSVADGDGEPVATTPDAQRSATRAEDDADEVDGRSPREPKTDEPKASKDSEPPQPVAEIEPSTVTAKALTISWPAATDNVGVVGYRIWLNGFEVATTAQTRARLRWFNDDSGQHVVQIRAIDAAGNQSRSSPTLVVTRPSPEPSETPTPEPSDSPTPKAKRSHPAAESTESSSAAPTGRISPTPGKHR